ncbi:MAG: ArsR family transcriptional regulator [Actinobacteria bacterium]|nr:MAG: ArsR family transcriptional regulator [Actinomycetota bacterium]
MYDRPISAAGSQGPHDEHTTRAGFVRRASGGALGLALLGGVRLDGAAAATLRSRSDVRHFRSRPDLRPPRLEVLRAPAAASDRYLFLSPSSGPGQRGVLILDDRGDVVWFRPTTPSTAMNFRTALYKGEPVLTWWQGKAERGLGRGVHVIVDSTYREIARLPAGAGRQSNLHEFTLTPRGTAIVTSYEVRTANLSGVGGPPSGKVIGGIVQEITIPGARVLFAWRSLNHVPIEESHVVFNGHAYDYFHVNSVDIDADGNLLVSARNTWTVYKVHRETGEVLWRLGGKRSDFQMGPGTAFAWQHDARHHDEGGLISLFDNGAAPPVAPQSRGIVVALDRRGRRARLVRQYTHPRRLLSPFMGNAQLLPNGNVVVGWGGLPYVTEFHRGGGVSFDARLPAGGQNYRAFRLPWVGHPHDAPRLVAHRASGRRLLYASWNGATEVAAWRLEAGARPDDLQTALTRPKKGFETSLPVPASGTYASAVALGPVGEELGRSTTIRL